MSENVRFSLATLFDKAKRTIRHFYTRAGAVVGFKADESVVLRGKTDGGINRNEMGCHDCCLFQC